MIIPNNNLTQYLNNSNQSSSKTQNTGEFSSKLEELQAEIDRRLDGVTCEKERSDIVMDVLGGVPLGRFDPSKVDDVLTPETRYQLTDEDKAYFAQKYDISNMTPGEMDEMLCEMEDMGAITQSERLAVNPYMNPDGSFKTVSTVVIYPSTHTGEGSSILTHQEFYYGGDPLNFWEERMRTLQRELVTGGENVDKDAHREELAGTQLISSLLGGIFGEHSGVSGRSADSSSSNSNNTTANTWVPYGMPQEDSTVERLKRSLEALLENSYDRARLEILDEEEEEQKKFDDLIDMVDKAIEATPEETLAEELMEELTGVEQ